MFGYILCVALVNIGLGFAIAVYLARRYQRLVAHVVGESPSKEPQPVAPVPAAAKPSVPQQVAT